MNRLLTDAERDFLGRGGGLPPDVESGERGIIRALEAVEARQRNTNRWMLGLTAIAALGAAIAALPVILNWFN